MGVGEGVGTGLGVGVGAGLGEGFSVNEGVEPGVVVGSTLVSGVLEGISEIVSVIVEEVVIAGLAPGVDSVFLLTTSHPYNIPVIKTNINTIEIILFIHPPNISLYNKRNAAMPLL